MTIKECVHQLIEVQNNNKQENAYSADTPCFGLARVGYSNQKIVAAQMKTFLDVDMGPPLHSFVICAPKLHHI